jgi:fimbrial isopeptide formation D2 family protein
MGVAYADNSGWDEPINPTKDILVTAKFKPSPRYNDKGELKDHAPVKSIKFVIDGNTVLYNNGSAQWNANVTPSGSGANLVYTATAQYDVPDDVGETNIQAFISDEVDSNLTSEICKRNFEVAEPVCGDDLCYTEETCDPPGGTTSCIDNVSIPAGQVCRDNCTFCGDGVLDSGEDCDPGIDENCPDSCSIEGIVFVAKSGPECIETSPPENIADFQIEITNEKNYPAEITQISDTLPQGMTYKESSTKLNQLVFDDANLAVSDQELVWSLTDKGSLPVGESITINYSAVADTDAAIGSNQNTVSVTTEENSFEASAEFEVQESCSPPEPVPPGPLPGTALGMNDKQTLQVSLILFVLAGTVYFTGIGNTFFIFAIKGWDKLGMMIYNPHEYQRQKLAKRVLNQVTDSDQDSKSE